LVAWVFRQIDELRSHTNAISDVVVGRWWTWSLMYVTPVVLAFMLFENLRTELFGAQNYEGYPTGFLVRYGWTLVLATLVFGVVAALKRWDERQVDLGARREVSA
jgi:NSS family neurotransmitter:Na+ symporter